MRLIKIFAIINLIVLVNITSVNARGYRGRASWYNYPSSRYGGMIAASRTLPCGTIVDVSHNHKKIRITIRDHGPALWTGRVIDLNRPAFKSLAPLGKGVINVKVKVVKLGDCKIHRH